ncbi:hypothetical protein QQ045_001591 [Rhodiola kirilowii]
MRKELLKNWALKWGDFTQQPVDDIQSYFGTQATEVAASPGVLCKHNFMGHFVLSILEAQLPFELAYAHLYEVIESGIITFGLTGAYLLAIQYFTRTGGRISVGLIKHESTENKEYQANSLVYKVFGLYFMQSYIGLLYHALFHRNFNTLREMLLERLIITEVITSTNLYDVYSNHLYKWVSFACRNSKKNSVLSEGKVKFTTKTEKEYLKPTYAASIGEEFEDGLFDDYLELALRFGLVMMFACAFPLVFAFAFLINLMEIRMDAFKLLTMFKRPVPRVAETNGAWLNIFQVLKFIPLSYRTSLMIWKSHQSINVLQFLIVTSICTNCAILICLYDKEGKWNIEPGLAAILVMEHVLLLVKFGISRFVPEHIVLFRAKFSYRNLPGSFSISNLFVLLRAVLLKPDRTGRFDRLDREPVTRRVRFSNRIGNVINPVKNRLNRRFLVEPSDPYLLSDEFIRYLLSQIFTYCIHEANVKVIVSSGSDVFKNKRAGVWEDFLSLLRFRGIKIEKPCDEDTTDQCWCPSKCTQSSLPLNTGSESPKLIAAVTSIIRSLGENPTREELLETPKRFLKWLMTFRNSNMDMNLNGHVRVMDCGLPNGITLATSPRFSQS